MDKLLVITEAGNVETLYSDDLPDLGTQKITRASNVEPDPEGGWMVQMSQDPKNGPYRGLVIARRVPKRADALALEVAFIQRHILGADFKRQDGSAHIGELLVDILAKIEEGRKARGFSEE